MKTRNAFLLTAALLVPFAGCSSSSNKAADKVVEDMLAQCEEMVAAFESVKDKDSAKAAAARINKVCDALPKIAKRAQKIRITKAKQKSLEKDFMAKMEGLQQRMQTAAFSAGSKCEGEENFMQSLQRLQEVGTALQQMEFQQ